MRLATVVLIAFAILAMTAAVPDITAASEPVLEQVSAALQQPSAEIDVDINRGSGGRVWYANPVWIAVGALAAVVLIVLVAMAARGGTTTVVK